VIHRCTIFHVSVGPVRIPQKVRQDTLRQTCVFLHPVGSVGHIVHFGASEMQNVNTLFPCSGGPSAISIKSALGNVMPNLCFGICCDLRVT
jgi:hypothetical protein